ncbi:MAG: ABC transporter permease [Eubacteriales bacterium]|nr:ABC transporter permease [Eubacteriales bacterium]
MNNNRRLRWQLVKRRPLSQAKVLLLYLLAIFTALLLGALLLLAIGHNPLIVYKQILTGSLATPTAFKETIKITIPLLLCGIAVAISFKLKFWNIGAEGQILFGATAAMIAPIYLPNLPSTLKLILMAVLAIVAGGLYALIPAFFKVRWGTNETLFTLMLNYIALQLLRFLQYQETWQDIGTKFPKIRPLGDSEVLPRLFGVQIGWVIALVLAVFFYIYLKRSKHGFEIAIVGDSINTAKYSGMNVKTIIMRTIFISGAVSGLVGYLNVAGTDYALTESTAGGVGFMAITVAWLAALNPLGMIPVAFGLSILQKGSLSIQSTLGIPASAANLLSGLILFSVLGSEFFRNYQLRLRRNTETGSSGKGDFKAETEHLPYQKEARDGLN